MRILKAWEFDSHGHGALRLELREDIRDDSVVVVLPGGDEFQLLQAMRDQWGVFYLADGVTVAQEDGTRSFIDAMIEAMLELRSRNESETTDATEVQHASEPRPAEAEGTRDDAALLGMDECVDASRG